MAVLELLYIDHRDEYIKWNINISHLTEGLRNIEKKRFLEQTKIRLLALERRRACVTGGRR